MIPCISQPRPTVGEYAPKIIQTKIDPEKIGDVVGQRGKTINAIIDQTGVKIDITDDGNVSVCGTDKEMMDKAEKLGKKLLLPTDTTIAAGFPNPIDAEIEVSVWMQIRFRLIWKGLISAIRPQNFMQML